MNLLKRYMERIIKNDVLKNKPTMSIVVNEAENIELAKKEDIGYAARGVLRKCTNIKDLDGHHLFPTGM